MAKQRKGYDAQDRVLARFKRDARSSTKNSAVAKAIAASKKRKKKVIKEEVRFSPKALIELYNG
jgi:hypothetical protein|tara:strand:+ start:222 stop:413 length:192 start_codon:yes stop_codon:yes gene_type:complete